MGTALTRRQMLARLGLAATAYTAPALLRLSEARASSASFSSYSAPSRPARPAASPPAPPEIVVTSPTSAGIDQIATLGYVVVARERVEALDADIARMRLPAGTTVAQARAQVEQTVPGALLDVNTLYRPDSLMCEAGECAAFDLVGWSASRAACDAVAVGMIDTGVNLDHAALRNAGIEAVPVIAADRTPGSKVHGTAIACLLAGDPESRTPGILPGLKLVAAEAFHRDARGQDTADSYDLARAIALLLERGLTVINMSLSGPPNLLLERTVQMARAQGVLMVAAAGNAGPQAGPFYPAAYEGVAAVTAVDRNRRIYRQASAGDHIAFAAPGVRLWAAASVSGGRLRSGTSFAAPFVTAVAAQMRARHPEASADQVIEMMAENAVDLGEAGRDATFGWGLVQAPDACRGGA